MGGNRINMLVGLYAAFAFETITITTAVKKLTQATYTDTDGDTASRAIITVEDAQIRYRYDGADPSATVGHVLNPFDSLTLVGSTNIKNFRIIRKGNVNATIRITYEH